jgi:hypothetical protein
VNGGGVSSTTLLGALGAGGRGIRFLDFGEASHLSLVGERVAVWCTEKEILLAWLLCPSKFGFGEGNRVGLVGQSLGERSLPGFSVRLRRRPKV